MKYTVKKQLCEIENCSFKIMEEFYYLTDAGKVFNIKKKKEILLHVDYEGGFFIYLSPIPYQQRIRFNITKICEARKLKKNLSIIK
jgi:hypothetical protein